jgi:hypothetical protein
MDEFHASTSNLIIANKWLTLALSILNNGIIIELTNIMTHG